jgi:hypothetical protein
VFYLSSRLGCTATHVLKLYHVVSFYCAEEKQLEIAAELYTVGAGGGISSPTAKITIFQTAVTRQPFNILTSCCFILFAMDPSYSHNILSSLCPMFFSQYGLQNEDIFWYLIFAVLQK